MLARIRESPHGSHCHRFRPPERREVQHPSCVATLLPWSHWACSQSAKDWCGADQGDVDWALALLHMSAEQRGLYQAPRSTGRMAGLGNCRVPRRHLVHGSTRQTSWRRRILKIESFSGHGLEMRGGFH